MQAFYEAFYAAVADSQAHRAFCERAFGLDLCQHGFADQAQLDLLLEVSGLGPGQRALDLGCGNGMITEYLAERSGATITGLDYIPAAISQAQARARAASGRLEFLLGDINQLELAPAAFDLIIAIDSIYFSRDYGATIGALARALRPAGQMALLYSYGREPWVPREQFPAANLEAERTPLAAALRANGLSFHSWDLTARDEALAQQRRAALEGLRAQFAAEGNLFIYENRMGDAAGISQAIAEGLHRRHLYLARSTQP